MTEQTITLKLDSAPLLSKLKAVEQIDKLPLYRAVAGGLQTLIELTFKRGVDPWGNAWKPLNPVLSRQGQPLRDTRRLLSSLTPKVDETGVTVGTNLIYAAVHQFGATIVPKQAKRLAWTGAGGKFFAKKVVIPRRAYLPLDQAGVLVLPKSWESLLLGRLEKALVTELDKAGV